jgi:hypothetical protein
MHIHTTSPAPLTFAQQENTKQIAHLRDDASDDHIAEHIRGIVAATLENLSVQSSQKARNDAEQWQHWALGVADGLVVAS